MESLRQNNLQSILTLPPNSEQIPDDLIIEIVLRLPTKSIARCRCVSKLWASILHRQDFTETFLARSSSRPQLLFAAWGKNNGKLFLFSSPQPQNTDENSSSIAAANYHMNFPCERFDALGHINGLVCIIEDVFVWKICNPSTRRCFTLPEVKTRKGFSWVRTFFGYDPIEKQVKVLAVTCGKEGNDVCIFDEHQILTLETGKMSWRKIECGTPHSPSSGGVCISGVLYYKAYKNSFSNACMIVCFDVRSETYKFIRVREDSIGEVYSTETTLINYNGKLASLMVQKYYDYAEGGISIDMWVLQEPERQEWSKHTTYKFPVLRNEVKVTFYSTGVSGTNEIVLFPDYVSNPFYVFYCNLERKTSRRVEIRGMSVFKGKKVFTFLDHIEDVRLI